MKTDPKDREDLKLKKYIPPTLTVYGKLTEITAGGSGEKAETQTEKNPTKYS